MAEVAKAYNCATCGTLVTVSGAATDQVLDGTCPCCSRPMTVTTDGVPVKEPENQRIVANEDLAPEPVDFVAQPTFASGSNGEEE